MNRMKRLIVFICYLFTLLNNIKINYFKVDLTYYLNLVDISNEDLSIMVNFNISITSRIVDHRKKKMLNTYK